MTGHSRIEVEVEGVEGSISVVIGDDGAAGSIARFSIGIRLDTCEPGWVGSDTLVGGDVHAGVAKVVELVQVVERERGRVVGNASVVHRHVRVVAGYLGANVAREIGLVDIEPDQRCYTRNLPLGCTCSR